MGITAGQSFTGKVGEAFSRSLDFTGVLSPIVGLPPGLTINRGTGAITGMPVQIGSFQARETRNPTIAARGYHSLAIRADGSVAAWGSNQRNESSVPSGMADNYVAVSGGIWRSIALRSNGSVDRWGYADDGLTGDEVRPPPGSLTNVVAISGSDQHFLALKSDGTVIGWGQHNSRTDLQVPSGLSEVVAIAAGLNHSLALRADGTVVGWGQNYAGQISIPTGLSGVVAIDASNHSLALKADGTVVAWGPSWAGQTRIPQGLSDVVSIAAGGNCSLLVRADGSVVALGETAVPSGLSGVVSVSAGIWHALALKSDGTIEGFIHNENYYNQHIAPDGFVGKIPAPTTIFSFAIAPGAPIIAEGINLTGKKGENYTQHPYFIFLPLLLRDRTNRPWSIGGFTATGLPPGLSITGDGQLISGIPTIAGTYAVTLTAVGPGGSDTKTISIQIVDWFPVITAGQSFKGNAGVPFSARLALTDGTSRPATSWSASGLPTGLSINATTGAITGTPRTEGSFTASVTAEGPGGASLPATVVFLIGREGMVPTELYAGRVEVIKAKILADGQPIATKFEVNKRFNGQYFVNARFRKAGALPAGISWESDSQGIRFFGVPQQTGTFEALFEGPYPNNFVGVTTEGNYSVDQCHPQSQPVNPGVQTALVFGWIVRFVVTTKSTNSVDFGTAWRNVLAKGNPALAAYREEWSGGGGGGSSSVPSAPQNLAAVPQDGGALITFNPPISDGGSPITGYEYQASLSDAIGQWTAGTFVAPTGATQPLEGSVPGLANGQTYTIRVRAVNAVGPGQASNAVTVVPSTAAFAAMRVVGNEVGLGAWVLQNSVSMTRQGAPAGYNWTGLATIADPATAKFKFAVGASWEDPAMQNWGDNDLPGANGYYIGDPGGADINFSAAVPGAIAGQYRFSFNETTYAWTVAAVGGGGGGGGTGTAPQIQTQPNPWRVSLNVGTPFTLTVTASGSPFPTFTATGLPAGLSISATGVISGTPIGSGSTATITATNAAGSDSRQIEFEVLGAMIVTTDSSYFSGTYLHVNYDNGRPVYEKNIVEGEVLRLRYESYLGGMRWVLRGENVFQEEGDSIYFYSADPYFTDPAATPNLSTRWYYDRTRDIIKFMPGDPFPLPGDISKIYFSLDTQMAWFWLDAVGANKDIYPGGGYYVQMGVGWPVLTYNRAPMSVQIVG